MAQTRWRRRHARAGMSEILSESRAAVSAVLSIAQGDAAQSLAGARTQLAAIALPAGGGLGREREGYGRVRPRRCSSPRRCMR